ncbi:hypothetical protein E2542_SST17284 [Spatholobus suberectus]|nr:hypothetical protein E2542_SST17284 [Spatholobus suberectus]
MNIFPIQGLDGCHVCMYMRRTSREKGIKPVLCDCQSILCCFPWYPYTQINWFIQIICCLTGPRLANATISFMSCEAYAFLGVMLDTCVVIFDDNVVQALRDKIIDMIDFYQSFEKLE